MCIYIYIYILEALRASLSVYRFGRCFGVVNDLVWLIARIFIFGHRPNIAFSFLAIGQILHAPKAEYCP